MKSKIQDQVSEDQTTNPSAQLAPKPFPVASIKITQIEEFVNWKNKLKQVVEENPFVKIVDNKSYELAKKRRTALRSTRVETEKCPGILSKAFKNLIAKAKEGMNSDLLPIIRPAEDRQQLEITLYEQKEKERKEAEKAKKEAQRLKCEQLVIRWEKWGNDLLETITIDSADATIEKLVTNLNAQNSANFEEYKTKYEQLKERLITDARRKKKELIDAAEREAERKELERLKAENEALRKANEKEKEVIKESDNPENDSIRSLFNTLTPNNFQEDEPVNEVVAQTVPSKLNEELDAEQATDNNLDLAEADLLQQTKERNIQYLISIRQNDLVEGINPDVDRIVLECITSINQAIDSAIPEIKKVTLK